MSDSKRTQECPICGSAQPLEARTCSICGAVLPGEPSPTLAVPDPPEKAARRPRYDPAEGDDDLYAGSMVGQVWRRVALIGVALALVIGVAIGIGAMALLRDDGNGGNGGNGVQTEALTSLEATSPPTATLRGEAEAPPTETPRPTMPLRTVTPAPPSPTPSPTQGPCMQTAQQGDTIYGMAIRCGHLELAIVDLILELNDMTDPNQLQLGQTLEIPWPTPTPGGDPVEEPAGEGVSGALDGALSSGGDAVAGAPAVALNEFGTPDLMAQYQNMEPTLRPGMAWHSVQPGETIISIARDYGTGLETISQINPEVPFLQCDFGSPTGGDRCTVLLGQGQRIRVPVPLPTVTYTPSPVGTLTPTPTPTATYNAPFALSPDEGAEFRADQMVTLRWGGTGTLGTNQRYEVRVFDQRLEREYTQLVTGISLILPMEWQPSDGRAHSFEWTVSLATIGADQSVLSRAYTTTPRRFTWASR